VELREHTAQLFTEKGYTTEVEVEMIDVPFMTRGLKIFAEVVGNQ